MGAVEVEIRDRGADSLVEIERLDVRRLLGGFGFYIDGLLVAAAWDGAFRLRYREDGRWFYRPVDDSAIDESSILVARVRDRAAKRSQEPDARRPRRADRATRPRP